MAAMLGTQTGILIHTTLVALGLSALLAASATAFLVLKIVGAGYLLWLAVDAIRNGSALNIEASQAQRGEPLVRAWGKGLAVNLLNPKVIMFFVTFLPQFVSVGDPSAAAKLVFLGIVFVVIATPIDVVLIVWAARLAAMLKRAPRVMRAIDWLFAGVFGAFAMRLIFTQRH
jgi:threonine/homoserine/homoserine lactone efflux protein